ncbi:hypothetical protein LCGC14_1378890 [marine sediment metagenome]|uniref:Uncharacterized protein n=1 Tax=marine sediment metagenome TaxID=412755 RepID=A0A0F9MIL9_9ZZZZ
MKRVLRCLILGFVLLLVVSSPAYAISNPSATSIGDVYVFRNVLETGDILVFVRYDVSYTTQPTEDAEDTFLMAIYGTDGTTLLFTRPLNYYQHNIISIYLDADTNTLTWGSAYYVRITGSPALFDPLVEDVNMKTRVLSSGDYRSTDDLGGIMIAQAGILETDWATVLLTATGRLNSTGSTYFLAAVPGLSSMVPGIFQLTTEQFVYTKENFTEEGINLTRQNLPVSLNNTIAGLDAIFGVTNHNWGGFAWLSLGGMMLAGVIYATTRRPDIAILGGFMGVMSIGAYTYVSEGNIMLFVMAIGTIIIVLFSVEYVLPKLG